MSGGKQETRPIFEVDHLTKFYGRARGVEQVSLSVEPGEIFGFLGPNGAGKTTVIRSALGLLRPTSGQIRLFGDPVRLTSDRNHERLGYLPADLRLWPGMTARGISNLLLKIGARERHTRRRDEIAERLQLNLDRRVKSLSLGNRQKVGIMLALQHDPDLIILDEPTSGLDPLVRRTVSELLHEFAGRGATIIYSSHNLPEVEQMCSRVGILRLGKLVALKTIDEIRQIEEKRLQFSFARGCAAPDGLPSALADFRLVKRDAETWQIGYRGSPDALLKWLAGFEIAKLDSIQVSLEESFMGYYDGSQGN
ncbi:ABC transporter ATP-binding protein [Candidatus Sumerlaeota bacterium]|nr:ABC transporter ATP-binding protein [Candidatus Sumerlaeota bacterium]